MKPKRILAMLLSFAVILSLVPGNIAFADEAQGENDIYSIVSTDEASPPYTIEEVKAMIDALPDASELEDMDNDELSEVYEKAQDAYDAFEALTDEEQAELSEELAKLRVVLDFATTQIQPLANKFYHYGNFTIRDRNTGTQKVYNISATLNDSKLTLKFDVDYYKKTTGTTVTKTITYTKNNYSCDEEISEEWTDIVNFNGYNVNFGISKSAGHYITNWTSVGSTQHTGICEICSQTITEDCAGGTATCTNKAVCTTCKQAYGNLDTNNHNWSKWTSNGDGTHTRTCSYNSNHKENGNCSGSTATCIAPAHCDICNSDYGTKDNTNHDYSGICDDTCNRCGEHRNVSVAHDYENGICKICGAYQSAVWNSVKNYYEISNAGHLMWFADYVKVGNTTADAVLTADINALSAQNCKIGTSEKPYAGTFDGNGHRLTINLNGGQYSAPFSYTNGATIKNLTTDGSITTSDKFAAGIVGYSSGNTKLENCMSFVTINSSVSGDATHGGLVANATGGSLTINNCAFMGTIKGENTQNCGGLVGWATVETKISNSYVAANFAINTVGSSNTIARNPGKVKISNCYYTNALGTASAENVSEEQVKNGELAYKLNGSVGGGDKWYQNIDKGTKDNYPVPNSSHGLVYYGYADCNAEIAQFTNTYTKKSIQGHNGDTATCLKAGYCADCGEKYLEIDSTAHETNETYCRIIDDTEHGTYHSCCNALIEKEKHTSSTNVATCTGVAKCDECKSSYGGTDGTNHTGTLECVDNGYDEHEYKYNCCGLVTETAKHNLTITADDETDTITVVCGTCSGNGTVTLQVSGKVYDGKAVAASYKATGFMDRWSRPVDISFDYCCEGGCKTARTHTVTMHVGDKEVTKEFTITRKTLTVTKVRAFSKAYDMTNEVFVNAIDLDGIVIYQKGDYVVFDIKDNVAIDLSKAVVATESSLPGDYDEVSVKNITLIGSDKDNYSIASSAEGVTLSNTYGGDYEIYKIQIWITPNDQTLYGDNAVLDQTAYTVEGLDDELYTLSGEFLYEDTTLGKIRVDSDKIKITYGDENVKQYFDITAYNGNVVHYCANHTFNDNGFCATGECDSYEAATLITKENCEDFGFKESEISEYEPKYAIYNGGQLYWFADRVNNYNETAIVGVLADDITVNEDLTAENLRVWTPIANDSMMPYGGSFYGNGHTVSGLYCKNTNTNSYVGFFGNLGYYTVSDLHIANSYFEGYYAGGIAGYSNGAATEKCSVSDDVTVKGTYIGGIYGYAFSGSAIENCFSLAKIDGTSYAGGLVGSNYTAIKNCYTDFMQPVGASGGEGRFENVYYTKDTRNYTNADGTVTQKPTFEGATEVEDFASGEVAYKLQSEVKGEIIDWVKDGDYNYTPVYDEAPQIWGQKIGTDKYPTFSDAKVYEDTYNSVNAYRNEINGNKILLLGADKKSATVVLNAAGTYTIVFADYEAMQLANLKTIEVTVDKAQAVRVTSDKAFTLGTGDKIMLWDNLENLTPMCEAYEVK